MVAARGYYLLKAKAKGLDPEAAPILIWGNGSPDGDAEPWLSASKGSLHFDLDATDDAGHVYSKVDEGGDDDDWVLFSLDGHSHA